MQVHSTDFSDNLSEDGQKKNAAESVSSSTNILHKGSNLLHKVAKRGRLFARRKQQRLIDKAGECRIKHNQIDHRGKQYLVDIFTTLLDMKWRYNLLLFVVAFCLSWLTFGLLWWAVAVGNGDHINHGTKSYKPCVTEVYDFTTALLFSIETQQTIGYGDRAMAPNCPHAVVLVIAQSVWGVVIQCLMAGIIFAKVARPKRRAETVLFSKNAVICQRDGCYCLLFRVGDMRRSQIIGATLHAMLVKSKETEEGEVLPFFQYSLDVTTESEDQFLFLSWPVTIVHEINERSPFWDIAEEDLLSCQFEVIVILEGIVEATGMTVQVRTSYLPSEIMWGHKLAPLLTYQKDGQYYINYSKFDATTPISMPDLSAKRMSERLSQGRRKSFAVRNSYDGSTHINIQLPDELLHGELHNTRRKYSMA